MHIDEQRKLKSAILANKDTAAVIAMLDTHDTEIMLDRGTPLFFAVVSNRLDLAGHLIKRGANVNTTRDGDTPLIVATDNKYVEMLRLLLDNAADVHQKNGRHLDALWYATGGFDLGIVRMLVEAGADPFRREPPHNYSAYDSAVDMEGTEMVAYFDNLRGARPVLGHSGGSA